MYEVNYVGLSFLCEIYFLTLHKIHVVFLNSEAGTETATLQVSFIHSFNKDLLSTLCIRNYASYLLGVRLCLN